jgi:hypothetical protein
MPKCRIDRILLLPTQRELSIGRLTRNIFELHVAAWKHSAHMLVSFRIEYTMELTGNNNSLNDLRDQVTAFQDKFYAALTTQATLGLVGANGNESLCNWCLKRYHRRQNYSQSQTLGCEKRVESCVSDYNGHPKCSTAVAQNRRQN